MLANKNLLIIHQGALGDFVLTFPAIIRLQKYYGHIDVLCQSGLGNLANFLGLIENWYPLEAAYVATLFTDSVDPNLKTLLRSYAKVILFSYSSELEKAICQITLKPVCRIAPMSPPYMHLHHSEYVLKNLLECQLIKKADAVLADIPLPKQGNRPRNEKKIMLHPGAGSVRKRWSILNFLEVSRILESNVLNPEFILGPAEEDLLETIQRSDRTVHFLSDLLDLATLLHSAGGYIGNDSGASHLAAFLGIPTCVIFGPTDPGRWAPVGRAVETVRPELECRPCFETETSNCEDLNCLEKTIPQAVIKAFYQVYSII